MSHLAAALKYAEYGLRVHPLYHPIHKNGRVECSCGKDCGKQTGKHPKLGKWEKLATTDPKQITVWWTQWPQANIGLAMGSESGVVLLDVDGDVGKETLAGLEDEHGELPVTWEATTGSGGRHLVFRHPGGTMPNATGFRPGLDFKADGGNMVAAPSVHYSGGRYSWRKDRHPENTQLAPLPGWVQDLVLKAKPAGDQAPNEPGWADEMLAQGAGEGGRDDAAIRLAGRYVALGLTDNEVVQILLDWNRRNNPPMGAAAGDPGDVADWVRTKVRSARQAENKKADTTLKVEQRTTLGEAIAEALPPILAGERPDLIHYGIPQVDEFTHLRRGRVGAIAGRTSMGKTAFALRAALAAADAGRRVLYVSLEMTAEELAHRALSLVAGVSVAALDTVDLTPQETDRVGAAPAALAGIVDRLSVHYASGLTPDRLHDLVEKETGQDPVDLVVVDHIGLMQSGTRDNEYQTLNRVAQALKAVAIDGDLAVLSLVQLNRYTEDQSRPTLRNLRGSGHLEEMADTCLLLYRPSYYNSQDADPDVFEVDIAKNRQGLKTVVTVPWHEIPALHASPGRGASTGACPTSRRPGSPGRRQRGAPALRCSAGRGFVAG